MINQAKSVIKRGLQQFASRFGPQSRTPAAPRLLILMYHRVLPADDARARLEEPGMLVAPETFRLHLNLLAERFELVSLSDWLARRAQGQTLPAKACAITFDDGWADNYDHAFPVLRDTGTPATIFLVADMIGTRERFWPERLVRLVFAIAARGGEDWSRPELAWLRDMESMHVFDGTQPSPDALSDLIAKTKKFDDTEIHARIDDVEEILGLHDDQAPPSLLDWDQVREMQASGLVEPGSHTSRHVRLNRSTPHDLMVSEIIDSRRNIEKHTSHRVPLFCFPNGDYTDAAMSLVRKHYDGAVTTASGWNTRDTDSYCLARIGIHNDITADKTAFLARLSGWL